MARILLATIAASLWAGTLPASAYSCAGWCSTYHCRMVEARRERVCMNRCVAACRMIVSKAIADTMTVTASELRHRAVG